MSCGHYCRHRRRCQHVSRLCSRLRFRLRPRPRWQHRACITNHCCLAIREEKDLEELSRLGHFLKGSSATLGLNKVKDSCEKIQRYGKKENEDGTPEKDEKLCLERITDTLKTVKTEYSEVETILKNFFNPSSTSST